MTAEQRKRIKAELDKEARRKIKQDATGRMKVHQGRRERH